MLLLYTLGIRIYGLIIWIFSFFNEKAQLFTNGRKNIFEQIESKINPTEKHIWFHFASLGEFEQGRTVIEKIKAIHLNKKIVITFFSPSGYEIRKSYALAEGVFYLPLDTKRNAKRFVKAINPEMAIFTKYEFWYFYFDELRKQNIPLYIISGIFREKQIFFKWYGSFYRRILNCVTYFFVQNEESEKLLNSIGLNNVAVSGDTRFDRVCENAQEPKQIPLIEDFIGNSTAIVCGSTWPDDEKLLAKLAQQNPDWKFIIAPHEIDENHLESIENLFSGSCIRFSKLKSQISNLIPTAHGTSPSTLNSQSSTLIIDNIGMLSSLYQYGKIAYIGGGFGAGIHNTLEAVAFGLPIIFGPKYDKFQEAKDLISIGVAKSITTDAELISAFDGFKENDLLSTKASEYVKNKKGATEMILDKISF
ncbi:3-deoxy-D-manno-octulosonic acid transferase [Pedobacter changchengzhani]|uniref:3-deoxy-D-manno-octulosonic acid transferase n=1 Tax=Pedobacter changchengzhani TaxID=2529274 RepID=A0A4R5MQP6_9SPHI|nr:glycosyltransferase N-terminal domain-containing protein [Pedobacter changchengzhani]TDG38056.1 3-deoxy-D-manno-octulosonic acid transferase [Pedobacter changchengzhani]